jgi:tRNA nucleotidyltransferase (CCA-adding enzyme)
VVKISKPEEAKNITDLSYSHVRYINSKVKANTDDIKIAKIFCHANNCYGAESYIKGFSGYALELLVYYYGGFLKMIKELSKERKDKIVIDIEKKYRTKKEVLLDMNSSKIQSPIILVDPTYPQRNALAALSNETFERFVKVCREFIKNPSKSFFEEKKVNLEKIREDALKKKNEFILLEVSTVKQEGDVAGTKLLKFYEHLCSEIGRFFEIRNKGFNYNGNKSARYFFVVKEKKEIIYPGPSAKDEKNAKKFRKEHKKVINKKNKLYSVEKMNFGVKEFIEKWKVKNSDKIKDMSIIGIRIIDNI